MPDFTAMRLSSLHKETLCTTFVPLNEDNVFSSPLFTASSMSTSYQFGGKTKLPIEQHVRDLMVASHATAYVQAGISSYLQTFRIFLAFIQVRLCLLYHLQRASTGRTFLSSISKAGRLLIIPSLVT